MVKYNYSHENNLSDNEIDYFFLLKQGLLMYCANNESCIAYDNSIPKREIIALKKLCEKHKRIDKPEPKKFYMVKFEDGFGIQNFDISQTDVDIEDNYNDEIIQFNEGLVSFLNSKDKGMVLLHGLPGTGKTTYIRHLISNCVARFIFLPTNLFYRISDPSFFTFILRYSNSVIILEDVEELLKPRDPNDNNIGISTLLNLSDGLLGDAMKLKIICTFNTDLRNIDQAILRKGRLAYNYKFLPLSIDKTNKLFNKLDIPFQSKVEMPLSEIYNYLHDNGNERQTKPKIGF